MANLLKSLRNIQASIGEWEREPDMAYKLSCFGREEIRFLRRQEKEILAAIAAYKGMAVPA